VQGHANGWVILKVGSVKFPYFVVEMFDGIKGTNCPFNKIILTPKNGEKSKQLT